ncbi:type II secretion system F family protein, partial [Streptomyces sp. PU_AKi4]|uniref:type II secretion system F family protein n=1 Tax=Streptomyces sp. PU_AKi4 TaxID=2800809 RepID=UPI003525F2AF
LRAERDQRADLRAQLAGARATAVLLAGLPVVGLALGAALGADPLHILLHTPSGLLCLAAGGVLEGLGLWWALRIMRGAEEGTA